MEKIVLSNGKEYTLVTNGVSQIGKSLTLRFLAGGETVPEIQAVFTDCESITVQTADGVVLQSPFTGFTVVKSVKLEIGAVVGQENIGTEDAPEYQDVTADVVTVELEQPGIEQDVAQLNADTEYLAMEMGVSLDE